MKSEKKDVQLEFLETSDSSLIAVQGPKASEVLKTIAKAPIDTLPFMTSTVTTVGKIIILTF